MPAVSIFGSGQIKLSHIKIDKDKYYYNKLKGKDVLRAGANSPFSLGDDEFFCVHQSEIQCDYEETETTCSAVDPSITVPDGRYYRVVALP